MKLITLYRSLSLRCPRNRWTHSRWSAMRFMGNGITSCYPDEVDNFISITVLRSRTARRRLPGSSKYSGRPWSPCRESPHRAGVGPAGKPSFASMSAAGPSPLAPTYTWCQSCGLRYALALPKRPRLCKRCGGSNPEDEGGAPERSAPATHRPSLLRHPGGKAPGPDNRRPVPPPPDWHARRQRRIGRCRTATDVAGLGHR